jgi:hypothetical protein
MPVVRDGDVQIAAAGTQIHERERFGRSPEHELIGAGRVEKTPTTPAETHLESRLNTVRTEAEGFDLSPGTGRELKLVTDTTRAGHLEADGLRQGRVRMGDHRKRVSVVQLTPTLKQPADDQSRHEAGRDDAAPVPTAFGGNAIPVHPTSLSPPRRPSHTPEGCPSPDSHFAREALRYLSTASVLEPTPSFFRMRRAWVRTVSRLMSQTSAISL